MYKKFFKRIIDFVISLIGLVLLSPIFLIIAVIVKMDSKGPIFFKQKRIGIHKTYFNILKFRTMRSDTPDVPTHLLKDPNVFITYSGKILRKTSLDELPQIINILMGKMSIIGPRPALWNQDDLISERERYDANDVLPGLTGLAQINGRDELPIQEKAKLDGAYVKHISFVQDVKIFFGTISSVLRHDGVQEGNKNEKKDTNYWGE
ncbi:sugar transferase [Dellaglioa sp. P0083]|uniref:sugar transferase n=1 Tax=Dellaglioa kimchii TaxID=3344667 RepID=UPI0038D41284